MIPPRRAALALIVLGVLLIPATALSASRTVEPVPPEMPVRPDPGVVVAAVTCTLGTTGNAAFLTDVYPPDDGYYTLIRPASCGACSVTVMSAIHVWMEFRVPCALPVLFSVAKSFGTTCRQPDPGQILFPAFRATLTAPEEGLHEFVVPVPSTWRLDQDAFLFVKFDTEVAACSDPDLPRLVLRSGCPRCVAYEQFGGIEDVCQSGVGIPLIHADVTECIPTPALPSSWGSLKLLYR